MLYLPALHRSIRLCVICCTTILVTLVMEQEHIQLVFLHGYLTSHGKSPPGRAAGGGCPKQKWNRGVWRRKYSQSLPFLFLNPVHMPGSCWAPPKLWHSWIISLQSRPLSFHFISLILPKDNFPQQSLYLPSHLCVQIRNSITSILTASPRLWHLRK